jgi:hypothetical protein
MDDTRTLTDNDSERQLQLRRRAKRGLVAGHIHELSGRHNGAGRRELERRKGRIQPARGD